MPVYADFIADVYYGRANLPVHFTDTSTGSPVSWDWDFGDGSPHSVDQNPIHVYTVAGTHTVTLSVTDLITTEEVSKDITVLVRSEFSANPRRGLPPLQVLFTDTSKGVPTSWIWDFGDGSPYSTDQNPSHEYTAAGQYMVTLTVNKGSSTDIEVKSGYISVIDVQTVTGFVRVQGPTLIFD